MSDTITEVKAVLTAEDRASAIVRNLRMEADRLAKSLSQLASIKLPGLDRAFGGTQAAANVKAVIAQTEAAAARAIRGRASLEAGVTRQRTADERTVDRTRRAADAASATALRARFAFVARMGRQQQQEGRQQERERRAVEAATMRDFRARMRFASAMGRQQAREARQADQGRERAEAAAERGAAASLRRQITVHRYLSGLRQRHEQRERSERDRIRHHVASRAGDALDHGRDAIRDTTRPVGVAALAGAAAAGAATRRILGAESAIDAAEINARIYGGLGQDAARKLRDQWAAPLAEALGTGTDKLLSSYTDALKLGIPNTGAQAFSELATKTSEAWTVPFENVVDILGTVNSILTSKGDPFNFDKLRSVANSIQHLAAKQSTTPERLMSFLQRGAGAAQVLGMSQEAGLAFGSASTSLGNQAGQSGRMFDYVASRIIELPRLTKQRGSEGQQARDLVRALGYGSAEALDRQRRANPDEFLPQFMDRFNSIKGQKKQDEAIRFFTGREWLGEFGRMVKGIDTYKEAVKISKEAKGLDIIGSVWDLHRLKLSFVFKQFRSGWLNILGEFGKVLSPMARQAGDTFLSWSAKLRDGGLAARFRAGLDGLLNGLGFHDLPDMLAGVFGKPGEGSAGGVESWRAVARGFGSGIRDVVISITGAIRALSGGLSDPETVARWIARIMTFSAAMVIASPAIAALGGITSAVLALGTAAISTWSALKLAGILTGSTAGAAGAAAFVGIRAVVGRLLGGLGLAIVAEIGAHRGEIVTAILNAFRSIWATVVDGLKADFAEFSRGGVLNGALRLLDPNFAPDPKTLDPGERQRTRDGIREDQGRGWMGRSWNWLLGRQTAPAPSSTSVAPSVQPAPSAGPAGLVELQEQLGRMRERTTPALLVSPIVAPVGQTRREAPRPTFISLATPEAAQLPGSDVGRLSGLIGAMSSRDILATIARSSVEILAEIRQSAAVRQAARLALPAPEAVDVALSRPQVPAIKLPEMPALQVSDREAASQPRVGHEGIAGTLSAMSPRDLLGGILRTAVEILVELRRLGGRLFARAIGADPIGHGGTVHQTAFSPVADLANAQRRTAQTFETMGARAQLAALASPSRGVISGFTTPGVPNDPAKAFGQNFSTPPGMSVPGWFGGRRAQGGGGGGSDSGMPDPGNGAGTGPYKPILDHIAKSEGTASQPGGGYNTSLGYGKFLPDGKEQKLTEMSLDQISALRRYMRQQPGNPNSSALGRYQIVGDTMRKLMRKLGLKGTEKFDEAMQDRLGAELVRGRGANPAGLGDEWASLRGDKLATAVDLARKIPQGASTAPEGRPNGEPGKQGAGQREGRQVVGGVHPLDGAGRLSSDFGMRRHPIHGDMRMHQGIDLSAPAGTIVKAMRDGIASLDRSGDVTLRHDDGTSTTYRHVAAAVTAGTRVAAGQAIARLRAHDPRSTGPHLHLEARDKDGRLTDPKRLLGPAPKAMEAIEATKPKAADGFTSSGWRPINPKAQEAVEGFQSTGWKPVGPKAQGAVDAFKAPSKTMPDAAPMRDQALGRSLAPDAGSLAGKLKPPAADDLARTIPTRPPGLDQGGTGFAPRTPAAPPQMNVTINAANMSPAEMGGHLQRHVTEAWGTRAHDLEPELT